MFTLKNKTILILSPQDWNGIPISKHHYAQELSRDNKILYLNSAGKKKLKSIFSISHISNKISVIDYLYVYYGIGRLPLIIISVINFIISKLLMNKIGKIDIVWSFEQSRFFNLNLFNADYKIFHPVDYIPHYQKYEKKIADSANIIFSVSEAILDCIDSNTPKIKINHGLFIPESNNGRFECLKLRDGRVNIAYIGVIDAAHIDRQNFLNIVKTNRHCDFHIISPVDKEKIGEDADLLIFFNSLSSLENVFFHSVMKKEALYKAMESFDIFFTCYDWVNNPVRISNSHKLLEYLFTGKVTITNYFSSYEGISEEILIMLKSNEDIARKINEVSLNLDFYNSKFNIAKRKEYALQFTYAKNLKQIENEIRNRLND